MMNWIRAGGVAALVSLCAPVMADDSVAPLARSSTVGGGTESSLFGETAGAAKTLQWVVAESELSTLPRGSRITGLRFRTAPGSAAWPAFGDLTFSSFEVRVSSSKRRPGTQETTFDTNIGADGVIARSGQLRIPTGSFPASAVGTVSPWGPMVTFSKPFVYDGGSLAITVRHSGVTGSGGTIPAVDAVATGNSGYNTLVQARSAAGATATVATAAAGAPVMLVSFSPPGSPSSAITPSDLSHNEGSTAQPGPLAMSPTTYQFVVSSRDLTNVPAGSRIGGLALRLDNQQFSWPSSEVVYSSYQVQISRSLNSPSKMLDGFSNNIRAGDLVTVRSGPLRIPAGGLPGPRGDGIPSAFGIVIPFTQTFAYSGGDLVVTIRHSGGVPASGTVNSPTLDAISVGDLGYGSFIAARIAASSTATLGTAAPAAVARLVFSPAVADVRYLDRSTNEGAGYVYDPSAYSYQCVFREDMLGLPRGVAIEAISFRLMSQFPGNWPGADAYFNDYTVQMGPAARAPGQMSSQFAVNQGAGTVTVRSGPLRVPQASHTGGATTNEDNQFGYTLRFQQPYVYNGGDLALTIRHSGNSLGSIPLLESLALTNRDYNGRVQAILGPGSSATSGNAAFATLVQFVVKPVTVVPAAAKTAPLPGASTVTTPLGTGAATYQFVLSEAELTDRLSIGGTIDSLAFRLAPGNGTWPGGEAEFSSYEVRIGRLPVAGVGLTSVFAANSVGELVVRSGPLKLGAGAYPATTGGAGLTSFGEIVPFNRPYVYAGGSVVVTIRHSGAQTTGTVGGPVLQSPPLDALPVLGGGYGLLGSAISGSGTNAVVGLPAPLVTVGLTTTRSTCRSDINGDGTVDDADFVLFAQAYELFTNTGGDLNGDGYTDDADFQLFAVAYELFGC